MSNQVQISMLTQSVRSIGAQMPKPVAKALDDAEKVAAQAEQLPKGTHRELMTATIAALVAGVDPLDDEEVRRLTTAQILGGPNGGAFAYGIQSAANERVADTIREHADDIIAVLKKAGDAAGVILAEAHAVIGDIPINDSATLGAMGPDVIAKWATVKPAITTLHQVDTGWIAVATLAHRYLSGRTLRLANLSLEQYEKVGYRAAPWDLIATAGATIDIATGTTILEREHRLTADRAEREAAAAANYAKAQGQQYRSFA